MFSSLPEDESLDDVKPERIKLDSSIYEEPIEVEELKDSVVIFDDMDVISDKEMVQYFRKQNSRWFCVFKNDPVVYMLEHEIGLLNHLDDDP